MFDLFKHILITVSEKNLTEVRNEAVVLTLSCCRKNCLNSEQSSSPSDTINISMYVCLGVFQSPALLLFAAIL